MSIFLKVIATALVGIIMCLVLNKQSKDYSILLSIAVCCMVTTVGLTYVKPLIEFLLKLENVAGLDSEVTNILFRCVGVGIVSEIAATVCKDAGNASLAKTIILTSSTMILYLCLPLFESLLDMITNIIVEI